MNKNKICIIGVYFGKLPNYFPLWMKSCGENSDIDFLVFTDQHTTSPFSNIRILDFSLEKIKQKASEVLGFECSLERPYKLCDYKPLYGLIFKEYLSSYDYWGHLDFDLIFGDLNLFFDEYNLYSYDRFNALGHLSLYRNTESVNNRYLLYDNYKDVFSSNKSYIFDEIPGITNLYLKNKYPMFTKRIFIDIATVYDRYRIGQIYKLDIKPQNYKKQIFYWENGKCFHAYFYKGQLCTVEYQYIHFQKRPNYTVNFDIDKTNAFYITKYGFIPKTGDVTLDIINEYNPYKGFIYEYFECILYKIKKRFNSLKHRLLKVKQNGFKRIN